MLFLFSFLLFIKVEALNSFLSFKVSDLTVDGALSNAMAGVNVVFHVASFGMR